MSAHATSEVVRNYQRAIDRWPDAPILGQYCESILACAGGNHHGVFEHVKSFIECVCRTILAEFGEALPSSDPSTTELLVAALRVLGLQNSRGASKLDKVLSAFNRLTDALSEMRNENGPVAHGKEGFLDAIEEDHARAFLHVGDSIIGVLLAALDGTQPNLLVTREPYERFRHLCDRIDRSVDLAATVDYVGESPVLVVSLTVGNRSDPLELRIEPSRLLYGIDRTAFVEALADSVGSAPEEDSSSLVPDDGTVAASKSALPNISTIQPPPVSLVGTYAGPLVVYRDALRSFLIAEAISSDPSEELVSSLLSTADQNRVVDWESRESINARIKIAIRRVLAKESVDPSRMVDGSERLLTWFQLYAPGTSHG